MAVQISGNDITVPRDGTFSRNVSIAGTLTYEDVTNVDSIGLVTARNGIEVGASPGVAASISVDGNMIVSGISTFGGDVQVPDKIIHAGDTNTSIRFPAADTFTVETGGVQRLRIDSTGDVRFTGTNLTDSTNKNINLTVPSYDTDEEDVNIIQVENESSTNQISFGGGTSGLNAATKIRFLTASAANTVTGTERFSIASDGDVTVGTGNLVIGTAGKGIDFSAQTATSASGASATSELLDHYEEGTWTPAYESTSGTYTYHTQQGYYTKIGNQVSVSAYIRTSNVTANAHNLIKVTGLPFAEGKGQRTPGSVRASSSGFQGTLSNFNFPVTWSVEAGQSFAELQRYEDGGNSDLTTSTMNNASYVYLQCTYQTA